MSKRKWLLGASLLTSGFLGLGGSVADASLTIDVRLVSIGGTVAANPKAGTVTGVGQDVILDVYATVTGTSSAGIQSVDGSFASVDEAGGFAAKGNISANGDQYSVITYPQGTPTITQQTLVGKNPFSAFGSSPGKQVGTAGDLDLGDKASANADDYAVIRAASAQMQTLTGGATSASWKIGTIKFTTSAIATDFSLKTDLNFTFRNAQQAALYFADGSSIDGSNLAGLVLGSPVVLSAGSALSPQWIHDATTGDWSDATHWTGGVVNSLGGVANFLGQLKNNNIVISLNGDKTAGIINIDNLTHTYTLGAGGGSKILLNNTGGVGGPNGAQINVNGNGHVIAAGLSLSGNTAITVTNGALTLTGPQSWNGKIVSVSGTVNINSTSAGVASSSTLTIPAGSTVNLGGTADGLAGVNVVNNSITSFNVTAGSHAIGSLSGVGKTSVSGGASLSASHVAQETVNLAGTLVVQPNGGDSGTSNIGTLNISGNGKLDLSDNDLVIRNATLADVQTLVTQGFNFGDWLGNGITSSAAANDPDGLRAVGYASNADLGMTDFSGQTNLVGTEILVKHTWYGDADLNGVVNIDDFNQFLFGLDPSTPATWLNGDFDYNGVVNIDDFNQFLFGLGGQSGPLAAEEFRNSVQALVAVPEPTSLGLAMIGVFGLLGRRVKRRA